MDYWPALLAADLLDHHLVLDDATRIEVPAPSRTATPEELAQPVHPTVPPGAGRPGGRARRAGPRPGRRQGRELQRRGLGARPRELGLAAGRADRRAGRAAAAEAAGRIVRHELPHLRAVQLVLTGLLGGGGSSNLLGRAPPRRRSRGLTPSGKGSLAQHMPPPLSRTQFLAQLAGERTQSSFFGSSSRVPGSGGSSTTG